MWLLVVLVGIAVSLNIVSAIVLKLTADHSPVDWFALTLVIAFVIGANLGRLGVWALIHRRYPLSWAYPLSASFFPCMLGVSWWFEENVGVTEILGAVLISIGVVLTVTTNR